MSGPDPSPPRLAHLTLGLCTLLHAFTHAFGTLLIPLYLLMRDDLGLRNIWQASAVVTIYGLVYCLGSYAAGVLADRFDRVWLLGIGQIGNALAILAIGLSRNYELILIFAIMAGLFGTLYHPCANALVPAHYPRKPGLAIGVLGIGAGIGFFAGPQYAGWRAEANLWTLGTIADWQWPCIEMGLVGIVAGILFIALARDPRHGRRNGGAAAAEQVAILPNRVASEELVPVYEPHPVPGGMSRSLRNRVIGIAAVLGCRDFAGVATLSLASIFLQKAHGYTAREAGFAIGAMMLISVVMNPLSVLISGGARRLPMLAIMLVSGGLVLATVPWWPPALVVLGLCAFQTCQLGSYAVSDAAMLERVSPAVRGRVVGVFLTLAGTFASLSPMTMGAWTDLLGPRAFEADAYRPIFAALAGLMILSAFSTRLIARLSESEPLPAATNRQAIRLPQAGGPAPAGAP